MIDARPTVLVVDDVDANLVAMDALLSSLDCNLLMARSGDEALRLLLRRELAVVLLDVQMPEMDGFEVAKLARTSAKGRTVPIIFVTAMLDTAENVFEGYESGAVDVLFKPVNAHMLLSKVQVFLDLYRARQALADEVRSHQRTLAELEAFNYSVSHDLRAPLRPIKGFSQILLEDHGAALDEDARALLVRISSAADRMNGLIDDLLRLAQVSRARPSRQPVDLSALAREILAQVQQEAPREVTWVVPDGLTADADPRLLRIALENLLRNAWKFTSRRADPRIELSSSTSGGATVFSVRDNGAGFPPGQRDRLFRAFQRLHATSEYEGTGIGLAIVARVIEHHGGRIWADAVPGQGATFSFTLGAGDGAAPQRV